MKFKVLMAILVCIFLHLSLQETLPAQENNTGTWQRFKNDFKSPALKVVWDKTISIPRIIRGTKVAPSLRLRQKINVKTIPAVIFDFLKKYQPLLRVSGRDVKVKSIKQFQNKWYVKAQTYYKGIPVFRNQVGFVLDQNGNILSYGSDCDPFMKVETNPVITKREAVKLAHRHYKPGVDQPNVKDAYLTIYQEISPQRGWHPQPIHGQPDAALSGASSQKFAEKTKFRKVLVKKTRRYRLVWYILLGGETGDSQVDRVIFLDALSGEKIKDFYPYAFSI